MFTGILLAGGKSKRMGQEKSLLPLHGQPLISYPLELMKQFCSEIFIVTQTPSLYDGFDVKVVTDLYREAGPMGGIFTGLQNASNCWSLVLACDMPYVRKELIAGLCRCAASHPSVEAVVPLSPERQPLCALYSKSALPVFYKKIKTEEHSLVSALSELETEYFHWLQLDPEDVEGISFMNMNTPADLEKARLCVPWRTVRLRASC